MDNGDEQDSGERFTRHTELAGSIGWARTVIARTDGILDQIHRGEWDEKIDDVAAETLRRRIAAITESIRLIRAKAGARTRTRRVDPRSSWRLALTLIS